MTHQVTGIRKVTWCSSCYGLLDDYEDEQPLKRCPHCFNEFEVQEEKK